MTELNHSGIKGQRWGVRRFQNPDGTLTAAGKARYKAYKKDYKDYDKLNRHVSASQKHLKEEGVMLDRVRDKYLKTNKAYRKEMSKSSGLFGLKAVDKAERVAKSQVEMEKVTKDYESAAGSYGVAKKIVKEDQKALRDHVTKMIRSYGKGSINDLKTETVKIGQNKLQKILQGAPMSIILNKGRDTEEFIKTGKTLADLPIVGNLYTANYIGNRELDITRRRIESSSNKAKRNTGKDGKDPAYIDPESDYFDGVTSTSKARKANKAAEEEKERKEAAEEKRKAQKSYDDAKSEVDKARTELNKARSAFDDVKYGPVKDESVRKMMDSKMSTSKLATSKEYKNAENSLKKQQKVLEKQQEALEKATKSLNDATDKLNKTSGKSSRKGSGVVASVVGSAAGAAATAAAGPIAGYAAKQGIKAYAKRKAKKKWQKWLGHSATYRVVRSDELSIKN